MLQLIKLAPQIPTLVFSETAFTKHKKFYWKKMQIVKNFKIQTQLDQLEVMQSNFDIY